MLDLKTIRVEENIEIGREVANLNGILRKLYPNIDEKLHFTSSPSSTFLVDRYDGRIVVMRRVDRESICPELKPNVQCKILMDVTMIGERNPASMYIGKLTIIILDQNDNVPMFEKPTMFIELSENAEPHHLVSLIDQAIDIDSNGHELIYSLHYNDNSSSLNSRSQHQQQQQHHHPFVLYHAQYLGRDHHPSSNEWKWDENYMLITGVDLNENDDSLKLFLISPIDYEKKAFYDLKIRVFDGKHSNELSVFIRLINENDNKPKFKKSSYRFLLSEVERPNIAIGKIEGIDADVEAEERQLIETTRHRFSPEMFMNKLKYSLISVRGKFYKNNEIYSVPKIVGNNNNSISNEVAIVGLRRRQRHRSLSSIFHLNPTTGLLSLKESIDREIDGDEIQLKINVFDGLYHAYTICTIVIVDENDNSPKFQILTQIEQSTSDQSKRDNNEDNQLTIPINVNELAPHGTFLTRFHLTDEDSEERGQTICCDIESDVPNIVQLRMLPDASIALITNLSPLPIRMNSTYDKQKRSTSLTNDYYYYGRDNEDEMKSNGPNENEEISFVNIRLTAEDNAPKSTRKRTVQKFRLRIKDENNHRVQFKGAQDQFIFYVQETNEKNGNRLKNVENALGKLEAIDLKDLPANRRVVYKLSSILSQKDRLPLSFSLFRTYSSECYDSYSSTFLHDLQSNKYFNNYFLTPHLTFSHKRNLLIMKSEVDREEMVSDIKKLFLLYLNTIESFRNSRKNKNKLELLTTILVESFFKSSEISKLLKLTSQSVILGKTSNIRSILLPRIVWKDLTPTIPILVRALDSKSFIMEAEIIVRVVVTDINDVAPKFLTNQTFFEVIPGYQGYVGSINAVDKDSGNFLTYYLVDVERINNTTETDESLVRSPRKKKKNSRRTIRKTMDIDVVEGSKSSDVKKEKIFQSDYFDYFSVVANNGQIYTTSSLLLGNEEFRLSIAVTDGTFTTTTSATIYVLNHTMASDWRAPSSMNNRHDFQNSYDPNSMYHRNRLTKNAFKQYWLMKLNDILSKPKIVYGVGASLFILLIIAIIITALVRRFKKRQVHRSDRRGTRSNNSKLDKHHDKASYSPLLVHPTTFRNSNTESETFSDDVTHSNERKLVDKLFAIDENSTICTSPTHSGNSYNGKSTIQRLNDIRKSDINRQSVESGSYDDPNDSLNSATVRTGLSNNGNYDMGSDNSEPTWPFAYSTLSTTVKPSYCRNEVNNSGMFKSQNDLTTPINKIYRYQQRQSPNKLINHSPMIVTNGHTINDNVDYV
ncbi:hypothetical protein SNEBB_004582 [Seison nebaliae]|nr:hypothetical protein SNEBB_004582 [Seison nebaliae]